jgi:integrase-like protein
LRYRPAGRIERPSPAAGGRGGGRPVEAGVPDLRRAENSREVTAATITDFASRYLLTCEALGTTQETFAFTVFERIAPGQPQQTGRHERMHLTLKKEATKPAAANMLQQQARFDTFVARYNQDRPHQALAMKVPADVYVRSPRVYRGLQELTYPFHFAAGTRRFSSSNQLSTTWICRTGSTTGGVRRKKCCPSGMTAYI